MKNLLKSYKASIILGAIALLFVISSFSMIGNEDASTIAGGFFISTILVGVCVLVTLVKRKRLKKVEQAKAERQAEIDKAKALAAEKRKRKPKSVPTTDPSKILFYDLETTGLSPNQNDEILQLAVINGNGEVLMNTLVKPMHKRKWTDAEAIHGISPEMVKDAPDIFDILNRLQELINDAEWLVGYNSLGFDDKFLRAAGIDLSSVNEFDVMLEYAERYNDFNERKGNRRWSKLTEAAHRWDYRFPAHDALNDAKATLYIFQKMRLDDAAKNMFYPE